MKPGKHQRRKQRRQDLRWKVHDRAQSFVLHSFTMHELGNQKFLLVSSSVKSKQLLCSLHDQGKKKPNKILKKKQQRTLSDFITIPRLTLFRLYDSSIVITIK